MCETLETLETLLLGKSFNNDKSFIINNNISQGRVGPHKSFKDFKSFNVLVWGYS